jgi:hypothetical protein
MCKVFNNLREKSNKDLNLRLMISSLLLGLLFLGSVIFFFFFFIMIMAGHAGELIWPLACAITSFTIFLFSLTYYIIVNKIRKEKLLVP